MSAAARGRPRPAASTAFALLTGSLRGDLVRAAGRLLDGRLVGLRRLVDALARDDVGRRLLERLGDLRVDRESRAVVGHRQDLLGDELEERVLAEDLGVDVLPGGDLGLAVEQRLDRVGRTEELEELPRL